MFRYSTASVCSRCADMITTIHGIIEARLASTSTNNSSKHLQQSDASELLSPQRKRRTARKRDTIVPASSGLEHIDFNKSTTLSKSKDEISPRIAQQKSSFRIDKSLTSSTLRRAAARRVELGGVSQISQNYSSVDQKADGNRSLKILKRDKAADFRLQFGMKQIQVTQVEDFAQRTQRNSIISKPQTRAVTLAGSTSGREMTPTNKGIENDIKQMTTQNTAHSIFDLIGGSHRV